MTTEIKNSIGMVVKPINWDQLMELVDKDLRQPLWDMATRENVAGVVVYEHLDLGSPNVGRRQFMIYGEPCTYKTIDAAVAGPIGSVPSQFAYPVAYWSKL